MKHTTLLLEEPSRAILPPDLPREEKKINAVFRNCKEPGTKTTSQESPLKELQGKMLRDAQSASETK